MATILNILLVGVLVGLMSSVLGLGGGIIIVPALSIYFGFTHQEAIATSLFTIVLVSIMNTIRFQRQKMVDWGITMQIILFSSLFSFIAGITAIYLPEKLLVIVFILYLLYMSVKTYLLRTPHHHTATHGKLKAWTALKIGSISGFIAGVTGIGGGGITTPMLLANGRVPSERIVPISNAVMIFTTLFSSFAFALSKVQNPVAGQIGRIHTIFAAVIFLSALPTALLGTKLQKYIPLKLRKNLLAAFLFVLCIRLTLNLL